jgi:Methyltransferase small domain
MEFEELGKDFVSRTASNPLAWTLYRFFGRLSDALGRVYGHARFTRENGERDETLRQVARNLFADLTVVAGPFKGLKYPSPQSFGSAFLPKLPGTYESEQHPVLEDLLIKSYTAIVDIGCAEGYYAVGLGLRSARAEIYAFDTDTRARQLCNELATLNAIDSRIHMVASATIRCWVQFRWAQRLWLFLIAKDMRANFLRMRPPRF